MGRNIGGVEGEKGASRGQAISNRCGSALQCGLWMVMVLMVLVLAVRVILVAQLLGMKMFARSF